MGNVRYFTKFACLAKQKTNEISFRIVLRHERASEISHVFAKQKTCEISFRMILRNIRTSDAFYIILRNIKYAIKGVMRISVFYTEIFRKQKKGKIAFRITINRNGKRWMHGRAEQK